MSLPLDHFELTPPGDDVMRRPRRVARGGPVFLLDSSGQLDPLRGSPEFQVPPEHLARRVKAYVESIDLEDVLKNYSGLGRRAVHPRAMLGVLLYTALLGITSMSKLASALETDAAFRLLSGGHTISATVLKDFRRKNGPLFERLFNETVKSGLQEGLIDPRELAIDGVRLRAHASTKAARTLERSRRRVEQLENKAVDGMTEEEAKTHEEKIEKHRAAIEFCEANGRTSYCTTNERAALMKMPNGATVPGHRVVAMASGASNRLLVGLILNSAPTDYGQLAGGVLDARNRLECAGMSSDTVMQVLADAGFLGDSDKEFVTNNRNTVDVILPPPTEGKRKNRAGEEMFGRGSFSRTEDGSVICPAGLPMQGPKNQTTPMQRWTGTGCADCTMKSRCTTAETRTFVVNIESERLTKNIADRFEQPGAREAYSQRMATIEPVFSVIEDTMGYRRVSSRYWETVRAEVFLVALAYNVNRLAELMEYRASGKKSKKSSRGLAESTQTPSSGQNEQKRAA